MFHKWETGYIDKYNPSIEYLELYAVAVSIFLWAEPLPNRRVVIFCDSCCEYD